MNKRIKYDVQTNEVYYETTGDFIIAENNLFIKNKDA